MIWFTIGSSLAMLPSLVLFFMAPAEFVFGNLGYAQLNTLYRQENGYGRAMTFSSKINYFLNFQKPGFWLFLGVAIFFIYVLGIFWFIRKKNIDRPMLFLMVLILFIFIGALLPTPSFRQYFYALVPFAILAVFYQVAEISQEQAGWVYRNWAISLLVVVTGISAVFGLDDFPASINPDKNATWFPLHAHWTGEKIASKVDAGKILTLAPIFVAEAGREIYPEFATGPFAWRTAELVPKGQRVGFGLVASDDLEDFLSQHPPAGILVGREDELEQPLLQYAEKFAYSSEKVSRKQNIWLP